MIREERQRIMTIIRVWQKDIRISNGKDNADSNKVKIIRARQAKDKNENKDMARKHMGK